MRAIARSVVSLLLFAGLVTLATTSRLQAQTFQGGLRGTVKDAQGVVPAATVVLVNEETKVTRETVSNAAGEYSFPAVAPGTYTVRANITGFKTFQLTGVRIGTQQFVNLGTQPVSNTPEEFASFIKAETDKWGKVIRSANIKAD